MEPHQHAGNRHLAYAAGIPGRLRILYLPCELSDPVTVCGLEAGLAYDAQLVHPETGEVTELGAVMGDGAGRWPVPPVPVFRDWLLVLEHRPLAAPEQQRQRSRLKVIEAEVVV